MSKLYDSPYQTEVFEALKQEQQQLKQEKSIHGGLLKIFSILFFLGIIFSKLR